MMNNWKVDAAHTEVTFAVKHMMVTTVRGRLGAITGDVSMDLADVAGGRGAIEIDLGGIDSGMAIRDAHLRGADFFDAENHPTAMFVIGQISPRTGNEYAVEGLLTIRGISRPIVLDATLLGDYQSMKGARRIGVSARTTISRKDWGLGWNVALESGGWLVSDEIRIELDLAATEIAERAAVDSVAA